MDIIAGIGADGMIAGNISKRFLGEVGMPV